MGMLNVSLESLYGDQLTKNKKSSGSQREVAQTFAKLGLMPVFFESCEDASVYAMEAANQYNEGVSYARMSDYTLESLARTGKLVKRANAKAKALGLESNVLSVEDTGQKFKEGIKRVCVVVRAALQRFIAAIANIIKTIVNWISGHIAKQQQKTFDEYFKHKTAQTVTLGKEHKINCPKELVAETKTQNVTQAFDSIAKYANESTKILKGDPKTPGMEDKGMKGKTIDGIEELLTVWKIEDMSNGDTIAKYVKNCLRKGKSPSSKLVVNIMFYKKTKPTMSSILMDSIKLKEKSTLCTNAGLNLLKKNVETAKKESVSLNKAMNWTQYMERSGEAKWGKGAVTTMVFVRNIHQFNVGCILGVYSEFLKIRTILYKVAKTKISVANRTTANPKKVGIAGPGGAPKQKQKTAPAAPAAATP